MTEEEWLAGRSVTPLLNHLSRPSQRKLRLFAVACCRALTYLLEDNDCRDAIPLAEQFADGLLSEAARKAAEKKVERVRRRLDLDPTSDSGVTDEEMRALDGVSAVAWTIRGIPAAEYASHFAAAAIGFDAAIKRTGTYALNPDGSDPVAIQTMHEEEGKHCDLLRDIFGNPFRPVAFSPEWRTDTAVSLARTMYEPRDFSTMPILADALQDAGCDSEEVLNHCRDAKQVHVRGCWVVDVVLEKE